MDVTADELAGVVDLFGGLSRDELERALRELAARTDGATVEDSVVDDQLGAATESFALLRCELDGTERYVAGPTAYPALPTHAEDLPHILDVPVRELDREALGRRVADRFEEAVDETVDAGDDSRAGWLLDASYEVEAWAPVDLDPHRDRLDDLLE